MSEQTKWTINEIKSEQGKKLATGFYHAIWEDSQVGASSRSESIAFVKKEKDAARIVQAVNYHEELKTALREAKLALQNIDGYFQQETCINIVALLRRIEEGK